MLETCGGLFPETRIHMKAEIHMQCETILNNIIRLSYRAGDRSVDTHRLKKKKAIINRIKKIKLYLHVEPQKTLG